MLKLPKGLKKKKKGKKSKRKGEDELFTEAELEKYRREQQQQQQQQTQQQPAAGDAQQNEEWSQFKHLTTGVDSVLRRTQGDLDRIKSTSFFQRLPPGAKGPERTPPARPAPARPVVELTAADFPHLAQAAAAAGDALSSAGVSEDESEEDEQDDIFDTSYVEAVERGEVRLGYVPDSPDRAPDDDLFDTSHVDALICGAAPRPARPSHRPDGHKPLDVGLAVGVLTGRIDNLTVTSAKRAKRAIPGDLLLDEDREPHAAAAPAPRPAEPAQTSILDTDEDIPITTPIDLSVSLHTSLIHQRGSSEDEQPVPAEDAPSAPAEEEDDEFAQLAAESLEAGAEPTRRIDREIKLEPVLQESWSAFEANKQVSVFAEGIVEDDLDDYVDQDDPFDTSFADAVVPSVPSVPSQSVAKEAVILEDDDDFDPRAEEIRYNLNNRRKSSVRIHLTDPSGLRESITSDDIVVKESASSARDLLGGSTTDLSQLADAPLAPEDLDADAPLAPEDLDADVDPFDTTIADSVVAPGRVELKLLEQELIGSSPASAPAPLYRVPSDPDFDPRAGEPTRIERRASRPENLTVVFAVTSDEPDVGPKPPNPVTPYCTRQRSITEEPDEEADGDAPLAPLPRARSDEDLASRAPAAAAPARRHSTAPPRDLLRGAPALRAEVLKPAGATPAPAAPSAPADPFDTSFAGDIAPSRTELRLLAKEFSCEETSDATARDLLEPEDDIFQVKALTPEPTTSAAPSADVDPFDTSFACDLNPGRTELRLLETEFLN